MSIYTLSAQDLGFRAVRAGVDFGDPIREWDGFGFNYVETAHTYDYSEFPQEYGGFSLLDENEKKEILELVFGDDGLKVGLVKLFLGPNHQLKPKGPFDHETTTKNMRYFAKEGLKLTQKRGDNLKMITTLYGPPAFMTVQKRDRGRDLDPAFKMDLANYMIDWVKFLKDDGLPIKYLSLHNEGEDWTRWTWTGHTDWPGHDYNLYWSPEMIVEYINLMPELLKKAGLGDVGITTGEPSNWYRFYAWGIAPFIAKDENAPKNLGLITSHGFYGGTYGEWFGEHNPLTNDLLRSKNPGLHSWVTSTSWSKMNAANIKEMHGNIYTSKVNGIIPWAGIQRPTQWVKGDPNPGCAIKVHEDGTYEVTKGYYFYKQVTRAGQPGMAVVPTFAMDSQIAIIGFSGNGTKNRDALVVVNLHSTDKQVAIAIEGTKSSSFEGYRTVDDAHHAKERYAPTGILDLKDGKLIYTAPPGSVTTFYAN